MTTQKAFFSYEEVIDLHTESDKVSVIGIHTPTGDTPRKLCPGFFAQFKKYKYLGCKVALVPAATLPADPLSIGLVESGQPVIDPRDMLNPILFHGCHGNDLGNILNRIYSSGSVSGTDLSEILHSDSTDLWNMFNNPEQDDTLVGTNLLESLYYRALTDKTWKKANVQRGFRIAGLRPRVYSLATNMYLQNATALGTSNVAPAPFSGEFGTGEYIDEWKPFEDSTANPVRYFTPRTVPLGWLDTRAVVGYTPDDRTSAPDAGFDAILNQIVGKGTVDVTLPKIFMGIIMLPPAYKQEMYFRMVINHYFAFAGFRGVSMSNDMLDNPNVFDWNDKLVDGDSDDPEPDPEPEPEITDGIILGNAVTGGYGAVQVMVNGSSTLRAMLGASDSMFTYAGSGSYIGATIKTTKSFTYSGSQIPVGTVITVTGGSSNVVIKKNGVDWVPSASGSILNQLMFGGLEDNEYFFFGTNADLLALFKTTENIQG